MKMKINHNIQALNAYRNLANNHAATAKSLEKLSSGLRINRAADDAAGLAISEKMKSQIRGLDQAERNILDGISLIQTAEGGLSSIQEMAQRMRELSVQAANDTLTDTDRKSIQKEIDQIKKGINDIANNTDVNGIQPLISSFRMPDGSTSNGKVDIIFVIDTSGSMGSTINNVKANIDKFVETLGDIDGQFGLVQYSDIGSSEPINKWEFTNDVDSFKDNIQDLRDNFMFGGGDGPESGLEGIMDATNGAMSFPFRDNSVKQFVLVTDAAVHESGDGAAYPYTYNVNDVAADLKKSGIKVSVVSGSPGSPQHTQLSELSDETGGVYLDIYSDFGDSLKSLGENINESVPTTGDLFSINLQVGANAGETFEVELTDARTTALGIDDISVETREDASAAITKLDNALQQISSERSKYGAYQNALEHLHSNVTNVNLNISAAQSRIADADMAKEMTKFTKNNILNQSAQAMLAQANQMPQGILQLLK
jgi:flagellin